MIFLVTGGSASGKSEYAEALVTHFGGDERYYIATMKPYDKESYRRIERHRAMRRDKGFTTVEWYTDLTKLVFTGLRWEERSVCGGCEQENISAYGNCGDKHGGEEQRLHRTALLECMSNLVANEMYLPEGAGKDTLNAVAEGVKCLSQKVEHLMIVTNEVFSDGIEYDEFTKEYLQVLGGINRRLAAMADVVVEVVYSIPVIHKGAEYVQFI